MSFHSTSTQQHRMPVVSSYGVPSRVLPRVSCCTCFSDTHTRMRTTQHQENKTDGRGVIQAVRAILMKAIMKCVDLCQLPLCLVSFVEVPMICKKPARTSRSGLLEHFNSCRQQQRSSSSRAAAARKQSSSNSNSNSNRAAPAEQRQEHQEQSSSRAAAAEQKQCS